MVRKRSELASSKKSDRARLGCKILETRFPQARCLWEQKVPNVGTITAYFVGKTIVLIQEYYDSNGWNAFVPATDDGRIDVTLDAIAIRAGIETAAAS